MRLTLKAFSFWPFSKKKPQCNTKNSKGFHCANKRSLYYSVILIQTDLSFRVMFALFIMGLMASMASAEPDPQFFYYPSYSYSAPSYYYPTYHYPTYPYVAPSYYYPSYVYPKKVEAPPKKVAEPEEMAPEVVEPQVTVKKVEKPLLRPIVPFFGLRSGEVQFLRPDEVINLLILPMDILYSMIFALQARPQVEQDEQNVLAYSSVPYTQAYLNRVPVVSY